MAGTVNDISSTTQQYLDIYDVSNDILILKDGSTALILTVSAMNFGLLAEPEQDAIMYAYAGLLNSLNYPIQIVIRSQTKDVTSYLQLLKDEEDKSTSETKRNWIARYRQFVGELIKERNVLDKKFYVSIPATSLEMGLLPPSTVLPGVAQIDISKIERSVILEKAREILEPKRDYLMQQFGRIGLQSRQLTTQEIIQFFYLSYNPEAAEGQQITDTNSYTTPLVSAGMQGGIMMDNVAAAPQSTQNTQSNQPTQPVEQQNAQQDVQPMATAPVPPMPQTMAPQAAQVQPEPAIQVATQPLMPTPVSPTAPTSADTPATSATPPVAQTNYQPSEQVTAQPVTVSPEDVIAPADTPTQPQQTNAPEVAPVETVEIQNEIDSTLKELGSTGQPTAAASVAPTSPVAMPPVPGSTSGAMGGSTGGSVPNSMPNPMPGSMPSPAAAGSVPPMTTPPTNDAATENLQPLPEI